MLNITLDGKEKPVELYLTKTPRGQIECRVDRNAFGNCLFYITENGKLVLQD